METKKLFSIAVAASVAVAAFGQTDITPAGLKFNTANPVFTGSEIFFKGAGGSNIDNNETRIKTLMDSNDRVIFWGMGNGAVTNSKQVGDALSIVDYGNGVGKVFRYTGTNFVPTGGWAAFAIYGDYRLLPIKKDGVSLKDATTRIRMVFNCDFPREWVTEKISEKLVSFSIKTAASTVIGNAGSKSEYTVADFTESFVDPEEEVEVKAYSPKWYSAEWDIIIPTDQGNPIGIFIGMQAGSMKNVVLNFKEISFTASPNDPREIEFPTVCPAIYKEVSTPTFIHSISSEQLAVVIEEGKVKVYGVPTGDIIRIISLSGVSQSVVSTEEITTIALPKGSYIISSGEKISKVIL